MKDELEELGSVVIPITPDQYSWSVLKITKNYKYYLCKRIPMLGE